MAYYIGIDLGTSAVKLLLCDESGAITKTVSREYPLYMTDDGRSEQNPTDWWSATTDGIKELVDGVSDIAAISFSGQMHGLVILDENDNVLRPAILWNDQRTTAECDYLNNEIGRDKLLLHTANIALTGFTAPKLLWVKNNEPDIFKRIRRIMLPKDYLVYKLTGIHATDYSDASGMLLLDVKNRCWSDFMTDIIGIDKSQLATLHESYGIVGNVSASAAAETHLSTSVKIIAGGGDQAVGAVGTGTVSDGMCSVSLGTSGVVFVASDSFAVDTKPSALHAFCHANGAYHMMGVTLAAAASFKWWVEDILNACDFTAEQDAIDSNADLGLNRVFYLPYLNGERTPHNDPYARGAFVGMSMTTERCRMTQAVMEGVTFSLRDTLERVRELGIKPDRVRLIGGGAKSPLWCQMTADIFNVKVERINSSEGPALGAAILAMVGDGIYASVEQACANVIKATDSYEPRQEIVSMYDKRYEIFKGLYAALKNSFTEMSR